MTVRWSVFVAPVGQPESPWAQEDPDLVLPTASVGKLVLLGELARQIEAGSIDPAERVTWTDEDFLHDSGLWHVLDQRDLTIADAARLVGAVSDNMATNVLLRRVGLPAVRTYGERLGLPPLELLDFVREERDLSVPGVAWTLSVGSARSLWNYMDLLAAGQISPLVAQWLSLDTDLSMVASAFLLDPLAHTPYDADDVLLINKTGTLNQVRADVGLVESAGLRVGYAAIAEFDPAAGELAPVMARMRQIGDAILKTVSGNGGANYGRARIQ